MRPPPPPSAKKESDDAAAPLQRGWWKDHHAPMPKWDLEPRKAVPYGSDASLIEKRIDSSDDNFYTQEEFIEHYGDLSKWNDAKASSNL